MNNRLQTYYQQHIRSFFISKYQFDNIWQIPKMQRLIVSMEMPDTNLELYYWFFYITTGRRPKFLIRKIKRASGWRYILVGLNVSFTNKSILTFSEKLLYFLYPFSENIDPIYCEVDRKGEINFALQHFATYPETEHIYVSLQQLILTNFAFVFNIKNNTKNKFFNECLFRMFQYPINVKTSSYNWYSLKKRKQKVLPITFYKYLFKKLSRKNMLNKYVSKKTNLWW
jgi:ribosomal protein L5